MSRAHAPNYPAQRLPPTTLSTDRLDQRPGEYLQQKQQMNHIVETPLNRERLQPVTGSRHSNRRLSSPLDFTDSIPFNELTLSTETLGSGSFGTVFKGRWRGHNVAVKHFKTREEIDSFSVEVKQLSRVKHPNIVKLYGASSPSKTAAYLIMEYAEGGSLNHLLHECRQQEYDLRHACSWAMQTARGVAYLHSLRPKPIMHRDLKPANLLLFSRGKILKICDFGTACAVKTQMTNNTGSASYMAPEVFSTSSYLESGDVFSWSIIFWEILARLQPYYKQYSNPYQILWRVNNGTRPREIENCPEIIWSLITRSWDKDPNERPSMKQVAKEMELIYSLARTSSDSNEADTRSLAQSPGEVPTPTNGAKIVQSPDSAKQMHNRCKAFVSRLISGSSARRTSSSGEQIITSSIKQSQNSDSSILSGSIAQEALEHQSNLTYLHDLPSPQLDSVRVVSSEHISHLHRQLHHFEEHSEIKHHQHHSSKSSSTLSQHSCPATNRLKMALRHLELLEKRRTELENELSSDRRISAEESFNEFANLKNERDQLKQLVKESGSMLGHSPSCPSNEPNRTPSPTHQRPQRSRTQQRECGDTSGEQE